MKQNSEELRMRQYINDTHLKTLYKELDRLQEVLYTPVYVINQETKEQELQLKPMIENADAILGKVHKQINDYKNEQYPDLFPGK